MTVSFFAIYKVPADKAVFDAHYFGTHRQLAQAIPGLLDYRINRVVASQMGESDLHMIVELVFESHPALKAAMASPQAKAAAQDVLKFGGEVVRFYVTEPASGPVI
ncbi:MAG: EthD family reductase [Cyanobacteria bacterium HKST-UBA05]|nr:EthD family reductase [Cyanobacteria bacterium HKST-UBA05]